MKNAAAIVLAGFVAVELVGCARSEESGKLGGTYAVSWSGSDCTGAVPITFAASGILDANENGISGTVVETAYDGGTPKSCQYQVYGTRKSITLTPTRDCSSGSKPKTLAISIIPAPAGFVLSMNGRVMAAGAGLRCRTSAACGIVSLN